MADVDLERRASAGDQSERLAALEERVARLTAVEAARRLLHDYARACDDDDADAATALFLPDAELWAGTRELRGHDAILGFYRAAFGVPTCHIVGAASFVARPDTSTAVHIDGRVSFVAVELSAVESAAVAAPKLRWGTYVDHVVVDGDVARFASRRITIDGSAAL